MLHGTHLFGRRTELSFPLTREVHYYITYRSNSHALLWSRKLRTASKSTRHGQVAVLGKHEDVVRAGRLPTRWRRFLEGSGDLEIRIVHSTRLGRPRAPQ